MAVRKLALFNGQSNAGPYHDIASWLPDRVDINLLVSTNRVAGAYAPNFTMPFNAPGFTGVRPLKGLALRNASYLTFYNPIVTGYTSYPGTGRVVSLIGQSEFEHTSITLWVEQQFIRGTHQVASIVRKTTNTTHTVVSIVTPQMTIGAFNDAPNTITLVGHGLLTDDRVTLTGVLPTGYALATTYYVLRIDADTIQLSLTVGGSAVPFTGTGGAAQINVAMAPFAGSRLMLDVLTPVVSPPPAFEEEFTHAIKATAAAAAVATATLNLNFGVRRLTTAKLVGLQLRHVTSGAIRIIDTWDSTTRTATLVNKVGLAPQTWTIAAGDELIIEPQTGVPFARYCYFLPWSMFESRLSEAVIGKINPWMPGFDFPGDFHVPHIYGTDAQTPTAVAGTAGLFNRTIAPNISWHVGMLVRLSEHFGEEVWGISTDFGGTSASQIEGEIGTANCGWYDKSQQTDWSPGRSNACFQRWLDELDAAIAAAALVGDTLEVVGLWRNQGFADATSASDPTYGPTAAQSGVSADKFLDTNRSLRARMRAALKARNLWPRETREVPIVQPLEQEETADLSTIGDQTLLTKVNTALRQLADEDIYAETWDQTGLLVGNDGIHFLGSELAKVEESNFAAWQSILAATDRTDEVRICNLALTHVGEAAVVTSINPPDASAQAQHCALYYPIARNAVLEAFAWAFATKRRTLQLVRQTNTIAWRYAYIRPADALRVLAIVPTEAYDDYTTPPQQTSFTSRDYLSTPPLQSTVVPANYAQGVLDDGTPVIYTNQPNAVMRYVAKIQDASRYPESFVLAVSWYLASLLSGVTIKGPAGAAMADRCMRSAQAYLVLAGRSDGNQQKVEPEHSPAWMQARL